MYDKKGALSWFFLNQRINLRDLIKQQNKTPPPGRGFLGLGHFIIYLEVSIVKAPEPKIFPPPTIVHIK